MSNYTTGETERIFCIGFHKTGTVSLATALRRLGYRVRHGYKPQSDLIKLCLQRGREPLALLEKQYGRHDAYADLYAVRDHFAYLDAYYTEAKFILTVRNEDAWVESCMQQKYNRRDTPYFHHWYFQNPIQWRYHYNGHNRAVLEYFMGMYGIEDYKEKLLIMNIPEGEGYPVLCEFLGKPDPGEEFPHRNKRKKP